MPAPKTHNSNVPLEMAEPQGGGLKGWWRRVCQQKLVGWSPRPSLASVLGFYATVSCLLLALGEQPQRSLRCPLQQPWAHPACSNPPTPPTHTHSPAHPHLLAQN